MSQSEEDSAECKPSLWLDLWDVNHASRAGIGSCCSQTFVQGHCLLLPPNIDVLTVGSFNGDNVDISWQSDTSSLAELSHSYTKQRPNVEDSKVIISWKRLLST